jgi:hypothetical protein
LASEFAILQFLCDLPHKKFPQMTDPGIESQTYHFRVRHPNHDSQNVGEELRWLSEIRHEGGFVVKRVFMEASVKVE